MPHYSYAGGVLDHEKPTIERFERDVLPYVTKLGAEIGERAMQGNQDAEEVIKRYNQFLNGMPEYRPVALKLMTAALKRYESTRVS